MSDAEGAIGTRLNTLLVAAGLEPVEAATADRLGLYVSLILRWNARVNLTAVRDEEGILSRHIIESIELARTLPEGIATLLDFGSGAGLPGIPVTLCRPEIAVTLAESQGKKAAFLQEAVRVLRLKARVHAGRADTLREKFNCVTLRAVDRMSEAVRAAAALVAPKGWLALMTTEDDLPNLKAAAGPEFAWQEPVRLPGGERRLVALGARPA
jgi:16S rRNA (guanine527-N7)-methyltransferase